jgi:hypothetical protein
MNASLVLQLAYSNLVCVPVLTSLVAKQRLQATSTRTEAGI